MTATAHLLAPRRLPLRWTIDAYLRRTVRFLVKAVFGLVVVVALVPVVLVALGYQPTVLRTDALQPVMAPGDVIVNEVVAPASVRVGDVVTFADADRDGPVTERIVDIRRDYNGYSFATQGAAADSAVSWSIPGDQRVTRMAFQVPALSGTPELPSALADRGTLLVAPIALVLIVVVFWGGAVIRSRRATARYW